MRQGNPKPKGYHVQKDSNVTQNHQYSDFLAPKYWLTWLGIAGLHVLAWLPWSAKKTLASLMGRMVKRFAKSRYRVLQTNIDVCFADKSTEERAQLVEDALFSNMLGYLESAYVWCRNVKNVPLTIEGMEHYEAAQATGKGIIFFTGHFSILDMGGAFLGANFDTGTVYRRHDNPLFNYYMTRCRENNFAYTIARKDVRGMIRHLRKGDNLCYLPDQDFGPKHSVFVPFFGVPTASITSTTALAKTGQAIVLPFTGYRLGRDFRYVFKFYPPLDIPTDDAVKDTKVWSQWLEQTISERPEQYLWLHKRFKTRPEGEPSIYTK